MTFRDLLVMSINNLRRRKLRTVLTVLGVVIGTASIVVMVSLGIGLNEMTVEQISSYGSLTTIEVSSPNRWGGSSENSDPNYITADVVNMLKRLPHVKGVSPVLSVQVLMRQGAYQAYASLSGVSDDYLNEIPVGEGERPSSRDKELRMSAVRYFGRYPDPSARALLLGFLQDSDPTHWEYSAISASSLAGYDGQDVVDALLRAMNSSNWYIRSNAASSLEAHGLSYEQMFQVLSGGDRYAREMLAYRLKAKRLQEEAALAAAEAASTQREGEPVGV